MSVDQPCVVHVLKGDLHELQETSYMVRKKIGGDSSGVIFEAEPVSAGAPVALKFVRPERGPVLSECSFSAGQEI